MGREEGEIQRAILDMFEAAGVLAWRNQSGQVRVKRGYMHLAPKGSPDILVVVPPHGRLLGIEVKTPKGKRSEDQRKFGVLMIKKGAAISEARNVSDAWVAYMNCVREL